MPPKRRGGRGRGRGGPPAAEEEPQMPQRDEPGRGRANVPPEERQVDPSSARFYQPPHQRRGTGGRSAPSRDQTAATAEPRQPIHQERQTTSDTGYGDPKPGSMVPAAGPERERQTIRDTDYGGPKAGPSGPGARPKRLETSVQEVSRGLASLEVSSPRSPPSEQATPDKSAVQPKGSQLQRALRPGYSTDCKKTIQIISNLYRLGCHKAAVYHYEVNILAKDNKIGTGEPKPLPKPLCHKILYEWVRQCHLEKQMPVYDGSKALYTASPLPWDDERSFDVQLQDGGRTRSFVLATKPVRRKNTKSNAVDVGAVMKYVQGMTADIPEDVRMVFETILSYRRPGSTQMAMRNSIFYTNQIEKRMDLGGGAELWMGYSQNIRFTEKGAAIVINTAAAAFYKEGPVIDMMCDMIRKDVTRSPLNPKDIEKLSKKLKGVNVCVTHQRQRRKYRIESLSDKNATNQTFPMDGRSVTVQQYFQSQYKMKLALPHLPCLKMASSKNMNVYIPPEVCDVLPNQRIRGKLDDKMTASMIKSTALPPSVKFRKIQADAENLKKSVPLDSYGLDFSLRPIETTARILHQPSIEYQGHQKCNLGDNGVWEMRRQKFSSPSSAKNIALICFADLDMRMLNNFARLLCDAASFVGLNLAKPNIRICEGNVRTEQAIDEARKRKVDLILVVLSKFDLYHSYEEVKFFADTKYGIISQCVNESVLDSNKMNMRTASNICLKINTKLGGVNHQISEWPIAFKREAVLIMGADVIHHAGDEFPSIAAAIGCIDEGISKYAVSCRAMLNPKSRKSQEIILDIKDMTKRLLLSYYRNNGQKKPQKILFYRDGISEGQFQEALEVEIPLVKEACRSLESTYQPPITYVVVQKRHPVRIRPKHDTDGIGKGRNVPPGTLADKDIVDPNLYEFYLCSHEGIQGTSKPTRYVVLFDENMVQPKVIESATYFLCHVFARCNRSISIPAPVKYADLLCTRASDYVKFLLRNPRLRKSSVPATSDEIPKDIDDLVKSIENVGNSMFFI